MFRALDRLVNNTSESIVNYIFKDIKPKKSKPPLNGEIRKLEDLSNLLYLMEIKRNVENNR
ncbi:MAG: hypothetical protein ACOCZ5_03820 [bacterium]